MASCLGVFGAGFMCAAFGARGTPPRVVDEPTNQTTGKSRNSPYFLLTTGHVSQDDTKRTWVPVVFQ